MIKDILVNLSYGTSQDGVSNHATSVAETFGAHSRGEPTQRAPIAWRHCLNEPAFAPLVVLHIAE